MSTVVIRGGTLVSDRTRLRADLICRDGTIAEVGPADARIPSVGVARLEWPSN